MPTNQNSVPAIWGPAIHSHERMLWQEGANGVSDYPIALTGHGIGTGSPELSEAITYTETVRRNGRIVPVMRTLRSAIEMAVTYDFGIPAAIWTPVMASSFLGCIKTFYLEYVCPEDSEFAHFIILERGAMTPAIEATDLIINEEAGEAVRWTTSVTVERRLWGWGLAYRPAFAAGGTIVLNGVEFIGDDCPGCEDNLGLDLFTVGGDATAAPAIVVTDDRFVSSTTPSVGLATEVAYTTYSDGDLLLTCIGDTADPSSATASNVYRSIDRGANFVVVPDIDIVVYDFVKAGDDILAVGVTTGGAAAIWISTDQGGTFSALTHTALPAAEALLTGAYDEETLKVYFGSDAGTLLAGRLSVTGINLTDITANLSTPPTAINEVVYLDKNNIIVVGAAGVVEESWDGGATWTVIPFPTSDAITCADGNKYRLVMGAGILAYERSFLTKNVIKVVALEDGAALTGNITDIAMNIEGDFNRIAVCTDDGEVALGIPRYPNA